MGFTRYFISFVAALIVYWMLIKKERVKKWYTCFLAVIFIIFTVFLLDFSATTFYEGEHQGAMVALLLFGLADLVIFALWKFSPNFAEKVRKDVGVNKNQNDKIPEMSRRDFLKNTGAVAAGVGLAALPIALINSDYLTVNSIDDLYDIPADLQRYDQKMDARTARRWNNELSSEFNGAITEAFRSMPPVAQPDIATLASGIVSFAFGSDLGYRAGNDGLYSWFPLGSRIPPFPAHVLPNSPWQASPEEATRRIKRYARDVGALDVGVSMLDKRWVYSRWSHRSGVLSNVQEGDILFEDVPRPEIWPDGTRVIPESMKYCVVLLHEMPYDMIATSPDVIGMGGTFYGYSDMAFRVAMVAEYIRILGWQAIPSGNGDSLSIPEAINAGLGQLGRSNLLIHPKYGPRVRITNIYTDLPLSPDKPIDFGVTKFCESCMKCADECPGEAIPHGPMTTIGHGFISFEGVKKWYSDGRKCSHFWARQGGLACSNCIRTCAYNKPPGYWTHDPFGVKLAPILGGRLLSTIDNWMGYGEKLGQSEFWNRKI